MTEKKCSVNNCKGKYEAWIDIFDDIEKVKKGRDRLHGRFPFCSKHFDKIFPIVDKRNRENGKDGSFYCWIPLSWINEALNMK